MRTQQVEEEPLALGAVGAKLIYPDGHLQGAGGIIMCRVTITIKYLPTITARANHPPVIFDTIELHYLREQRRAELEGDLGLARKAALIRARELYLAQASDMVWVVSTYEAELLRRENAALRIEVVPLIQTMRAAVPPFAARRDLMFIGGFRHPPNEDAVLYFVRQIFPRVKREIPQVRLLVVGTTIPPAVRELAAEDVVVAGYVKDIAPVFDSCRVFVAPLRYGAGLTGTITQSLACGLPVVTTTIGAEGLHLRAREHALIADDPEDFAAGVVDLYKASSRPRLLEGPLALLWP